MALVYVNPVDLYQWWETIKPGIEECRKRGETWIVEDVYHAIKSGGSSLYVGSDDDGYIGFLVVSSQQGFDGQQLFIWCCYAKTEDDPIAMFIDDLKHIAKQIDAKRILFGSHRNWSRRLTEYGWKQGPTIYGLEL